MAKNIGIYVFDDVEALDFAGPYEVFTTASRVSKRFSQEPSELFNVFSVSAKQSVGRSRYAE